MAVATTLRHARRCSAHHPFCSARSCRACEPNEVALHLIQKSDQQTVWGRPGAQGFEQRGMSSTGKCISRCRLTTVHTQVRPSCRMVVDFRAKILDSSRLHVDIVVEIKYCFALAYCCDLVYCFALVYFYALMYCFTLSHASSCRAPALHARLGKSVLDSSMCRLQLSSKGSAPEGPRKEPISLCGAPLGDEEDANLQAALLASMHEASSCAEPSSVAAPGMP